MKKVISILLLICIVFILPVSFTCLYLYKQKVKSEVKWRMIAGLKNSELVELKFSNEQLETEVQWEHSKEFEYRGQMYDVVSRNIVGDSTQFFCWWDYEETELNKKLTSLVQLAMGQRQNNKSSNQQNQLRLFMSILFYSNPFEWKAFFTGTENIKTLSINYFWKDVNTSEPSPPPEILV